MFSERKKKQGNILFNCAFPVFLLITSFGFFISVSAQDVSLQQTPKVAEEQDYAFAYGIYSDSLFQLADQQFQTFVSTYPNSIKKLDAAFLSAENFFDNINVADLSASVNETRFDLGLQTVILVASLLLKI